MNTNSDNKQFKNKMFFPKILITHRNRNPLEYCRTNSINYAKELLLLQKPKLKQINFFNLIIISKEEYEKAIVDSNELVDTFTNSMLYDIKSVSKPILIQKHLMELFNYIINLEQTFDWNLFKRISNVEELRNKMRNVDFNKLSKKQFNFYLNRFTEYDKNLPRFIPQSLGMNHLYKWIKCQITIFIFLVKNKLISQPVTSTCTISNEEKAFRDKIKNKKSKNDFFIGNSKHLNQNVHSMQIIKTESNAHVYLTSVPSLPSNRLSTESNNNIHLISKSTLALNGINVIQNKMQREAKVMQYIPLVKHRTFEQMRKFYKLSKNTEDIIDRKHYFDLKKVGVNGIEDKDQLTYLLSKNKIYILDALSEEKRKKLLELNI